MDSDRYFSRYGISTFLLREQPLAAALDKIARAGFRILELWGSETHLEPRLKPNIDSVRSQMASLGLKAHSLHAPFYPDLHIGDPDPQYRQGWREALFPAVEYTAELGASGMVVHVSTIRGENTAERCAEGAKAVIAFLAEELAPMCRQAGVHILLENMVNYGWPRFGCQMQELVESFPGPDYRFCLDIGHAALDGMPIPGEVKIAGHRLMSIHASNNDGQKDLHLEPTKGIIDWQEFADALESIGYTHPIILEVSGWNDADAILQRLSHIWQDLPG